MASMLEELNTYWWNRWWRFTINLLEESETCSTVYCSIVIPFCPTQVFFPNVSACYAQKHVGIVGDTYGGPLFDNRFVDDMQYLFEAEFHLG